MPPNSPRLVRHRLLADLARARSAQRRRDVARTPAARALTAGVCFLAGLLVITSAVTARGDDLRPGRNTDLIGLVERQARRNAELSRDVTALRRDVDTLSAAAGESDLSAAVGEQAAYAGLTAVTGPAVTVTLTDAPASVSAEGIDPDLLVVHQQDIQAVVNALWAGGAEAMTIQGQRVIATTGIKCVGNTVVLHGIPYAPPYVISALGDIDRLNDALDAAEAVRIYQQYVDTYGLGYSRRSENRALFPGFEGAVDLAHAQPVAARTGSRSPAPR